MLFMTPTKKEVDELESKVSSLQQRSKNPPGLPLSNGCHSADTVNYYRALARDIIRYVMYFRVAKSAK